jgi:type VI secretion system secreted protein Hcp
MDYATNGIEIMTHPRTLSGAMALALATLCAAPPADAEIFVRFQTIPGEFEGPGPSGNHDWFVADSFSFGVEREMKESGEKGGTADINIGVGELQECTISKSMDMASPQLAQFAINGNTLGSCEVCFTEFRGPQDQPQCYLHYVMERCYVKSWSTSGDADDRPTEEVAFYYNKIAFAYQNTAGEQDSMDWDQEKNRPWPEGADWALDFPDEKR